MPLLAVARELRSRHPDCRIIYVGERGGKFAQVAISSGVFDECRFIYAGKIRRYHGESLLRRITDIRTILLNARDLTYMIVGFSQSILFLRHLRPSVALLKGGFVCVPIGLASRLAKVPLITHDSDASASLSNRIAGKGALYHAVAIDSPFYPYPKDTIRVVGVPANPEYAAHQKVTSRLREKYGVKGDQPLLLVTGGSQGSRRINTAIIACLPKLIETYPDLYVFHHVGDGNNDQYQDIDDDIKKHVSVFEFSEKLYEMSALASVVVTRAGATTLAEFGSQGKACIVIPHSQLAGDHQTKNAEALEQAEAAIVVREADIHKDTSAVMEAIIKLLGDPKMRERLSRNIHQLQPELPATESLVDLIEDVLHRQERLA